MYHLERTEMKKLLLIYVGIFCSVLVFGQTNFQKLTLDEACTKAKAEKKLVFVDLYTSWCAPCKMMADKVFPDVKLGAFMNERFVCVKYDTGADKDGSELAKMFNVQAYPTFLILNVDKELKTILIGAGNLGKAVSNKIFIRQSGFKLIGIFDKNEAICGNMIKGIPVRHINYLENFCIDNQPVCAVICIPGSDMQEITDMLVRLGVRAFWNFSNYDIAMAHPEVLVENVHLNDSLMTLGYLTNTSLAEDEAR